MDKKHRLPVHIKPERYKIMLKTDLNELTFYGEETIYLILDKAAKQITLHSVDLEIETAEFIHTDKQIWAAKISYDVKKETATFSFPKVLQKGTGQLRLTFRGILNDKMRGFYRSKYEVDGMSKHLATTQFESTDARRAFPCFDEPSQKAVFDVTLMVPAGTKAISNTIESEIKEHESGYQIVEFAPTPKMSTYLLAFIVGEFDCLEGKTKHGKIVRVFTTPGKNAQGAFALDVAKKCLDFYEDYFDIAYPLPILDLIAIPDFAAGAMENWGAITYRESTLLIEEESSSTANKQWVALVIAHEIAHQWFGNLVTMEWWTHLWLNEGFASFIEYLAIDEIFPEWDIWTQFVASETGAAFELDSLNNTHPIEVPVGHPAEISEIFDKVSYSKGAAVLRMLMSYIGEKDFQRGLQNYLKTYAYSNAATEDLWVSLEKVSKKPVSQIMRNWILKPGHPLVRVQVTGGRLQLTQSRFFSSPLSKKASKDKTIWSIPIQVTSDKLQMTSYLLKSKSINIPKPALGQGIVLNEGQTSFYRVDYPRHYLKKLESAIKSGTLSAADRLGLIRDTFDLAKSGNTPTTLALELNLTYIQETDFSVWSEITAQLDQLGSLLAYEPCINQFNNYSKKIFTTIANKLGWEKKAKEKHTDSLLRSIVLYKLGSFGDQETIGKAQELFQKGVKDPDLKGVVYSLIAENGKHEEFDRLLEMYKKEPNQQEKDRIGRAVGLFKSKALLQKTLKFSLSDHVRYQNSLQIIASVWGNPAGRYLAWEFVKENWHILKERYAGGHYFTRVFTPAGRFTKKEDAKDIEKFVKNNPVPEAKRTIAQALEQIYLNAEWLKRDKAKINNFLHKYSK